MEEAPITSDQRWCRQNSLWGRFDIHSVYVARGAHWEPIVQEGRLDLRYRATPTQWAEGLTLDATSGRIYDCLTWLTPFDLSSASGNRATAYHTRGRIPADEVATLRRILESLLARMSLFLPGKHHTPNDVWNSLSVEERSSLQEAMEQAALIPVHRHDIRSVLRNWPGRWTGMKPFRLYHLRSSPILNWPPYSTLADRPILGAAHS
jgi:hypothetical protein